MIKKIATGFSIVFHPLLMPTIGVLILLFSGSYISYIPFNLKRPIIFLIFSGTCLFPAIMIPFIYMRGMITDLQMKNHYERILPISLTLISYMVIFFLFLSIPAYHFLHGFVLGSLLEVLFALLINYRWKISIHMMGLGGITAFLLVTSMIQHLNLLPYVVMAILASGIVASSRLILGAHTEQEVYAGFLTGMTIMGGCLLIFYQIV
jgi:hypothetical protein